MNIPPDVYSPKPLSCCRWVPRESIGSITNPHWSNALGVNHLKPCSQPGRIVESELETSVIQSRASIKELLFWPLVVFCFQRCSCLNVPWPCTADLRGEGNNQKMWSCSVMLYFKAPTCAGCHLNASDHLLSSLGLAWPMFCHEAL